MTPPPAQIPRLAALAVTLHQGRVLLVRRRNPPDQGLWGYPGGKVDFGETVFAAAARELREETGVVADPVAHLQNLDIILRDSGGALTHHFLLVAVLCRYRSGEARAADDAEEAAWFPHETVLTRRLAMSEDVDLVLREALKREESAGG